MIHNHEKLKERRRELRKGQTPQEEILWQEIRNNKLGIKLKRQHSIGGYILDFYCSERRLIIELDGEIHNKPEAKEYDNVRNKYFEDLGYKTLRFRNSNVDQNLEEVLIKIKSI